MANSSSPMLRVANMFRCPNAPLRLQHRQFQSLHRLMRPSPPRSQFKPYPKTSPPPPISPRPSPSYRTPPPTTLLPATLIALCTTIYAYSLYAAHQSTTHHNPTPSTLLSTHFILSLPNLRAGRYHTLLTHTLTHLTPLHLLVNLYALYSFAPPLIATFGPRPFLALFFAAGTLGGAVPMAWQAYQERRRDAAAAEQGARGRYEGAVGASAAVLGLVGAEACLAPRGLVYVFPLPVAVPAYLAVGGFAVFSAAALQFGWVPGWGHLAHLTGTTVGVLAYAVVLRGRFRG